MLLLTSLLAVIAGACGTAPHAGGGGPLTLGSQTTVSLESRGADDLAVGGFLLRNGAAEPVRVVAVDPAVESDCTPVVTTWREPADQVTGTARSRPDEMGVVALTGSAAMVAPGETVHVLFAFNRNDCLAGQDSHYGPVTVDYVAGDKEYRGTYGFLIDLQW